MICPFCSPEPTRILSENSHALALLDNYPVSPGHTLIVPRRHVASLFETSEEERRAIWELLEAARRILVEKHKPDGFNIGVNDGAAAGQTVMHLHVHLIPRYAGDAAEPRGGVRWIFPDKAAYWEER
ncbi:MAG TPA: HIT family protein [Acidobacteriota bacterium]|nr:HIT family protein [Acidobacteriota bacterium]